MLQQCERGMNMLAVACSRDAIFWCCWCGVKFVSFFGCNRIVIKWSSLSLLCRRLKILHPHMQIWKKKQNTTQMIHKKMRLKKKMNKCKTEGNRECRERVGQQQPKKKNTRMQQFFSLREKGKKSCTRLFIATYTVWGRSVKKCYKFCASNRSSMQIVFEQSLLWISSSLTSHINENTTFLLIFISVTVSLNYFRHV